MMRVAVQVFVALLAAVMLTQASGTKVISLFGENITIPCNGGDNKPTDLIFTKWKYTKNDGSTGDLLVKQAQKEEAKISATDSYKDRISITPNSSLVITQAALSDQTTFTCMVVSLSNLNEYPVDVEVRKRPSAPELKNKASQLENGKSTPLGECVTMDANPPAEIVWLKNNKALEENNKTVIITTTIIKDSVSGLSTSKSRLLYTAGKEDMASNFACLVRHVTGPDQVTTPVVFSIYYPTEKVSLQVMPAGPVKEGDNVTLKCQADGNPPPTNFNFHIKGKKVAVTGSNVHVVSGVTRADSGEYKCSLPDNDKMEASVMISVNYLDLSVSPSGKVLKSFGQSLNVKVDKNFSSEPTVIWTKDSSRLEKLPDFTELTYRHAGVYVCEMSVGGIKRNASFQLVVEGIPVIKSLTKKRSPDGKNKVLTCEAEGSPQPDVQWNVNGTDSKNTYINGKATFTLTVVPRLNLTVTCRVFNSLGNDSQSISVLPLIDENSQAKQDQPEDDDKAKLIVGIVVGLIVVAALVGISYWLYMKRRQGTWKTGEKEMGTSEESKKLEENSHRQEP